MHFKTQADTNSGTGLLRMCCVITGWLVCSDAWGPHLTDSLEGLWAVMSASALKDVLVTGVRSVTCTASCGHVSSLDMRCAFNNALFVFFFPSQAWQLEPELM